MNHQIRGYNECLITYVMTACSPTHAIGPEVYHEGWARGGAIKAQSNGSDMSLTLKHNGAGEKGGAVLGALLLPGSGPPRSQGSLCGLLGTRLDRVQYPPHGQNCCNLYEFHPHSEC